MARKTPKLVSFASVKHFEYPDFLDIQLKSFKDFFQLETNSENRINEGLYKVFSENFPITDARNNFVLDEEENNNKTDIGNEQIIALMSVYLSEWEHRDELLWTQVFKYFYATLVVIILPNATKFFGIELPEIKSRNQSI